MKRGKRSPVTTFVALVLGLGFLVHVSEVQSRPYHGHHSYSRHARVVAMVQTPQCNYIFDPSECGYSTQPAQYASAPVRYKRSASGRVRMVFNSNGTVENYGANWQDSTNWGDSLGRGNSSLLARANSMIGMSEHGNRGALARVVGVDPARTPWCAAWANAVLRRSGYGGTGSNMARSFYNYGHRSNGQIGDIAVLRGGHHVGFVAGYTYRNGRRYVQVLGGNQHNRVQVSNFPASGATFRNPS